VVTADGRLTRAGGRVVKNVAGYDVGKLYIGSLGTLGVIVEATFKLAALPKSEETVTVPFETATAACDYATDILRRGLSVRSLQLLNAPAASAAGLTIDAPYATVLDLAGGAAAVERSRGEISQGAAPTRVRDPDEAQERMSRIRSPMDNALVCRASVLPTYLPALMERMEATGCGPHIVAWPTVGILYAAWAEADDPEALVGDLRAETLGVGGTFVVEFCDPDLKGRIDVFGDEPPGFGLMRRVKEQFDPKCVLAPGRFVGKL
jgi:glycolate oxidase FAD binding subunit